MEVPQDVVGRRVSCGGERATVRYAGPVPPTPGVWLGVEWDKPERGKHDGSHQGVQYFSCSSPGSGSFVRPEKVSFGQDFLEALKEAYSTSSSSSSTTSCSSTSCSSSTLEVKEWLVGTRNVKLCDLLSVSLSHCEVNGPGAEGGIRTTAPNIQSLDLSNSLLTGWLDVAAVTQQLEGLTELQLSSNRLLLPPDPSSLSQAFLRLNLLVLNRSNISWQQVLKCAPMWPQLERLYLDENNISELQRPDGVLQTLKSLTLRLNPLEETSVACLAELPRLKNLNLSDTGLSSIRFDDVQPGSLTSAFPALTSLNLDHNHISEWSVVDELAKLPRLESLRCRGNPLQSSDGNRETTRQIYIAKLGGLVSLDGCEVLSVERRGAELDYMKLFGEDWLKTGGQTQFTQQHPRYQQLITKYGAPDEGLLKKREPSVLKNNLLKITFIFPEESGLEPLEKKLPNSMLVLKVKALLYRILKVPADELRLTYTTPAKAGTEFDMESNLKTLKFYSLQDGDQVLVRWS